MAWGGRAEEGNGGTNSVRDGSAGGGGSTWGERQCHGGKCWGVVFGRAAPGGHCQGDRSKIGRGPASLGTKVWLWSKESPVLGQHYPHPTPGHQGGSSPKLGERGTKCLYFIKNSWRVCVWPMPMSVCRTRGRSGDNMKFNKIIQALCT